MRPQVNVSKRIKIWHLKRIKWNTDILLSEASDGAVSVGAEIQRFDPALKKKRRETVFPQERKKAFEMGRKLAER